MAALVASVPLPLLLDSLLASSWTWLALSLATIATLLRALNRNTLSRHRPQALLPPPTSIFSAETEKISSLVSEVSHPLRNTQKFRSKSSHATPLPLHEAASAPKIFNGQPSTSVIGDSIERAPGLWPRTTDCKLGLRLSVGFLADTQKGGCETPTDGFIKEDVNPLDLWTSDVFPEPLHNSLFDGPCSSSEVPPCFEMQLGWCKLLQMRLGASWQNRSSKQVLKPTTHDERVVKVWSTHQRNLFKALMVEESSVAALDVNIRGGLAITACRNGEIFQWDIANQACLSRVCSNVKLISALCLNAEKGVALVGNGEVLGLWDYKSPSLIPIMDETARLVSVSPYSALRCKGDMLRIDQTNGAFSFCDLRKPQGICLSIDTNPDSLPVLSKMEEEESFVLWEKLAFDEDLFWDEYHIGHGDAIQKSSSFTSRCTTLVRSLSASGR